jgi:transposase-like protein
MKNDSRAYRAYTREENSDWIRRYRDSGLALSIFAEEHGLARNRLHYWVYNRRYSQRPKPVAAAPVFQELKLTAGLPVQTWAAEISLPTGAVARFSAASPPAWINTVMEVLRRPC